MSVQDICLNIACCQEQSRVNGPGNRFVLWLQGCPLRCPGCLNPEMQPFEPGHRIRIPDLAGFIAQCPGIEGVTYTGGEPMEQAHGLTLLTRSLRSHGLSVVCFTGYTYSQIAGSTDPWKHRLLSLVDILIDGPYKQQEAASLLWRGSRNQRVRSLTDRYRHIEADVESGTAQVEVGIESNELSVCGIWPEGFVEELQKVILEG